VLKSIPLSNGGPKAYGINLCVEQWGLGDKAWAMYRPTLYDAQDNGLFRFDAGVTAPADEEDAVDAPPPESMSTPITNSGCPPSRIQEGVEAPSPRDTRDQSISVSDESPKTEPLQKSVDETVQEMIGPPENPDDFELQSPPNTLQSKNANKLNATEIEARIDVLFERMNPTLREAIEGYLLFMASNRVYKQVAPKLRWKTIIALCKLAKEPGITPENVLYGVEAALVKQAENTNYVAQAARGDAMRAQGQRPGSRRAAPSLRFIQLENGGRTMERDWSIGQKMLVEEEIAKENWDVASGCSLEPLPGFCCVDGMFYGSGEEPTPWK